MVSTVHLDGRPCLMMLGILFPIQESTVVFLSPASSLRTCRHCKTRLLFRPDIRTLRASREREKKTTVPCPESFPSAESRKTKPLSSISGEKGPTEQLPRLRCRGVLRHRIGQRAALDVRNGFPHRGSPRCRVVQHDCGAPAHCGPGGRPN